MKKSMFVLFIMSMVAFAEGTEIKKVHTKTAKLEKDSYCNIPKVYSDFKKINEIISCIEKRYETLDKIVNIIIAKQENFFLTKGKILNTLKELEVAKELNISPSTVSRAINEKYIKTNFGIISLKKLFPKNTENIDIQNIIMKLIEQENKNFPYTDEELVNLLKKSNFFVARRTVTKYRNLLGYKSSLQRKRK